MYTFSYNIEIKFFQPIYRVMQKTLAKFIEECSVWADYPATKLGNKVDLRCKVAQTCLRLAARQNQQVGFTQPRDNLTSHLCSSFALFRHFSYSTAKKQKDDRQVRR